MTSYPRMRLAIYAGKETSLQGDIIKTSNNLLNFTWTYFFFGPPLLQARRHASTTWNPRYPYQSPQTAISNPETVLSLLATFKEGEDQ